MSATSEFVVLCKGQNCHLDSNNFLDKNDTDLANLNFAIYDQGLFVYSNPSFHRAKCEISKSGSSGWKCFEKLGPDDLIIT